MQKQDTDNPVLSIGATTACGSSKSRAPRLVKVPDRSISLRGLDPDALLTTRDVSRLTGLSEGYLAQCRMEPHKGPAFIKLGRIVYRAQALRDWLRQREVASTTEAKA